ncbi:MAG TPA: TIGR00282 family metallophosphoesterase [Candidatus Babeliales bacterium]|nr:TIGR00282 family metallophosphoesterase [Candidatus Babeliales bacterium]
MKRMRILFLGDVVGETGRMVFEKHIQQLRQEHQIDALVVNGENSAGSGKGITPQVVEFFKTNGVNVITTGNHIWQKSEIYPYLQANTDLLRPANFPRETPGVGVTTFNCDGVLIGVINIQGRVFMRELLACPFRTVESILIYLKDKTNIIFVDFHAETTSEKMAMGFFLDGKVTGMVGTHTHVQTADERILPGGTAYITDLGMAGSLNSMIGMKKDPIIKQLISQMPTRYMVETEPPYFMTGAWIEFDVQTGKALAISRVRVDDTDEMQIPDSQ